MQTGRCCIRWLAIKECATAHSAVRVFFVGIRDQAPIITDMMYFKCVYLVVLTCDRILVTRCKLTKQLQQTSGDNTRTMSMRGDSHLI